MEIGAYHLEWKELSNLDDEDLRLKCMEADDERIFAVAEALSRGNTIGEIWSWTKIDVYFLHKLKQIILLENELKAAPFAEDLLREAKRRGFTDRKIAELWQTTEDKVRELNEKKGTASCI